MGSGAPSRGSASTCTSRSAVHRCHYCDFNTYEGQDDLHDRYVDALVRHDREHEREPSRRRRRCSSAAARRRCCRPGNWAASSTAVRASSAASRAMPRSPSRRTPRRWTRTPSTGLLEAGFNRVSIGVQSLGPARSCSGLGRTHSPEQALAAIAAARRAGVDDVNADLIYGSPWESPGGLADVARRVGRGRSGPHLGLRVDDRRGDAARHARQDEPRSRRRSRRAGGPARDGQRVLGAAGYETLRDLELGHAAAALPLTTSSTGRPATTSASVRAPTAILDGPPLLGGAACRATSSTAPRRAPRRTDHEVVEDRIGEALMLGLRLTSGVSNSPTSRNVSAPSATSGERSSMELVARARSGGDGRTPTDHRERHDAGERRDRPTPVDGGPRQIYVAVVGAGMPSPLPTPRRRTVGRLIAERGGTVVCGGMTGVMEAACRGAKGREARRSGSSPPRTGVDANPFVDVAIATGMGEMRNALIVRTVDVVVAIGGEYGTLSEIAFALRIGRPVVTLGSWGLTKPDGAPADVHGRRHTRGRGGGGLRQRPRARPA